MLDRRRLIIGAAAATLAAGANAQANSSVVIRTSGGLFGDALKKYFFDPFTKSTGIKVVPVSASYGDMIAKIQAMANAGSVQWDVVSPQAMELPLISKFLVDLGDCSSIPNLAMSAVPGSCDRYGVRYLVGANVFVHNTAMYKAERPRTWADFWDVKRFPGPRSLGNTGSPWTNALIPALLADGVKPDELFPLDVERAFRKLDAIKPHVEVWWKTSAQNQQLVRSGSFGMISMYGGQAYAAKQAGVPIDYTFDGSIEDMASWAILKNSPNPKAAAEFINCYLTQPDNHAAFAREIGYATSNRQAADLLDPQVRNSIPFDTTIRDAIVRLDGSWIQANRSSLIERFNVWISS